MSKSTPSCRKPKSLARQNVPPWRAGPPVEGTGHTDPVGSEGDNDRLSLQRAEEVLGWLASQGFDRSLMSATGRGERELKQLTIDNFSSAANRRVEVIVR